MPRIVTLKTGGETHSIDLDAALRIHNADAERHEVAADVAWWGVIAAAATAQVDRLTAVAASWHANALVECLKADDKMSEWKAKANATGHPEYQKMQLDIANAQELANKASSVHWALVRKMSMLESMITAERGTARAADSIGRSPAPPDQSTPQAPDSRLRGYKGKGKPQEG